MSLSPNFEHQGECGPGWFLDAWGDGPIVIRFKGKVWRFEFSTMFGPLLLTANGEAAKRQPDREDHPFWIPFNLWMEAGQKCRAVRTSRGKLRFWVGHVPPEVKTPPVSVGQ